MQSTTKDDNSSINKVSKKPKCFICQKKVGVFGLQCKCGNIYCAIHFHAENHDCTYDYKQDYNSSSLGGGEYKKIDKI